MMCAVNTDFYIMPDKAGIVDGMILFRIFFHLHSIPRLCCVTSRRLRPECYVHPALLLCGNPVKVLLLIKVLVINLVDVCIYCFGTAGMFPFPADIEAWRTL